MNLGSCSDVVILIVTVTAKSGCWGLRPGLQDARALEAGAFPGPTPASKIDSDWNRLHCVVNADTSAESVQRGKKLKKGQKVREKHNRCRIFGVRFCGSALEEKMRKNIVQTVQRLCQEDAKKLNCMDGRDKLLSGHWCFLVSSKSKQSLEEAGSLHHHPDPDAVDPESPDFSPGPSDAMQDGREVHHLVHVSFVWGALKQFTPVFARMNPAEDTFTSAEHAWPSTIEANFGGTFLDFFEFLRLLLEREEAEWSLQVYELVWSVAPIAALVPGSIHLAHHSHLKPCIVWMGAAAETARKKRTRGPNAGSGPRRQQKDKKRKSKPTQDDGNAECLFDLDQSNDGGNAPPMSALMDLGQLMQVDHDLDLGEDENGDLGDASDSISDSSSDSSSDPHGHGSGRDADTDPNMWDYVNRLLSIDAASPMDPPEGPEPEVAAVQPDQASPVMESGQQASQAHAAAGEDEGGAPAVIAEPEERRPRASPAASGEPRAVHDALFVKDEAGEQRGWIKIKPSANDAFCKCPYHPECFKTKTLNTSDAGRRRLQGRPLGFLAAWALEGQHHSSKNEHVRQCNPSWASRKAARSRLHLEPNAQDFLALERARFDGEDSEPERCP